MQDGDWKRASHLVFAGHQASPHGERHEQELFTRELRHEMRLKKFLEWPRFGGRARHAKGNLLLMIAMLKVTTPHPHWRSTCGLCS